MNKLKFRYTCWYCKRTSIAGVKNVTKEVLWDNMRYFVSCPICGKWIGEEVDRCQIPPKIRRIKSKDF